MQLITQSIVLRALGWSLLNSFWQMASLWLLYTVFINIFRRSSANIRHGLASLLLTVGTGWTAAAFAEAFMDPAAAGNVAWLSNLIYTLDHYSGTRMLPVISNWILQLLPYASTGYLLIICWFLIRYSGQYLYVSRLKNDKTLTKIAPDFRLFVEETRQLMGVRRKVQVWLSTVVEGPVTLGWLKPIILVPVSTVTQLNAAQVEALLLHELAHIRRHDYLLNLGISLLATLYFFNPFARLLIRDIRREREHRCDDLVIQFKYDPQLYITALLSLASGPQPKPQLVLSATGGNDQLLLRRVRRILRIPGSQDRPAVRSLALLLFTFALTALIGLGLSTHSANLAVDLTVATSQQQELPERVLYASVATTGSAGKHILSVDVLTKERSVVLPVIPFSRIRQQAASVPPSPARNNTAPQFASYTQPAPSDDNDEADNDAPAVVVTDASEKSPDIKREYSMTTTTGAVAVGVGDEYGPDVTPYVPNSSFSYKFVQDSARPDQQFVYLQRQACQEAEAAVVRMQKQLQYQLHIIGIARTKAEKESLTETKEILEQQLKLQVDYLHKQQELQKKYEKAAGKKVKKIVII